MISVLIDSPLGIVLGPMADQYLAIDEEMDLGREVEDGPENSPVDCFPIGRSRTAKTLTRFQGHRFGLMAGSWILDMRLSPSVPPCPGVDIA